MELNRNVVGWFEIPVSNMERATRFYETVFGYKLERHELVFHKEFYKPSTDGVLIYFTCQSGDLSKELARVEPAGGSVLMPKKLITEDIGYMALCVDTEGNKIALHSRN